jgi:hypothetical protein
MGDFVKVLREMPLDSGAHPPGTGACVMESPQRLWPDLIVLASGCVEFASTRNSQGYGYIWDCKRKRRLHRVMWELAFGPIPDGQCVLHRCDNPPCCNPAHLFLGTKADNNADRAAKGRSRGIFAAGPDHPATQRRGGRHWQAKLSNSQVLEIRRRRSAGVTCRPMAAEYGVHEATISRISRGEWR